MNEGQLRDLHTSRVSEAEIDELGHLSAPFYDERALQGSYALAGACGLPEAIDSKGGLDLALVDGFRRNYREQFLGATLVVRGGVFDVDSDRFRFYHELVNADSNELSAAFVHELQIQSTASRAVLPIPEEVIAKARDRRVGWPEHGRGRTLDLDRKPVGLTLGQAREKDLAFNEPQTITADECDAHGFVTMRRFQHLPYIGESNTDSSSQWIVESEDGRRLGMADLETRNIVLSLPRAGDRVQACSAVVALADKTFCRYYWIFDLQLEKLLGVVAIVIAMLDLEQRRAASIPPTYRATLERHFHPDLK